MDIAHFGSRRMPRRGHSAVDRTVLACERASLDSLRDRLAIDRTALANERTVLAYLRTAMALLAGAGTLLRFFWGSVEVFVLGGLLAVLGTSVVALGVRRYRTIAVRLRGVEAHICDVTSGPTRPQPE